MRRTTFDFPDRLDEALIEAKETSYVNLQRFVIGRVARTTIFQHPPSRVTWKSLAIGDSPRLVVFPVIDPSVWDRLGGPVVFRIRVTSAGTESTVFERALDPRNRAADQCWREEIVDLSPWQGTSIDLCLRTASPRGQGVAFGWAGWADMRLEHSVPEPVRPSRPPRRNDRPNVLLITCDALRRDHLGCYGALDVPTPNIDRLAAEGMKFNTARSQSDATFASYASLHTSLLPVRSQVLDERGRMPSHVPILPTWLAGQGYHTILAASEVELSRPNTGCPQLFHEFVPTLGNPAQRSIVTVRRLQRRLERTAEPWFAWLQLFDPHPPTVPSQDVARRVYPWDPTDRSRRFRPDLVGQINALETLLEIRSSRFQAGSNWVPSRILARLLATVDTFRHPSRAGPDLHAHLENLGDAIWGPAGRTAFVSWLDRAVTDAAQGKVSQELDAWIAGLSRHLGPIENQHLGWLSGVVDFRYPMRMYAAGVMEIDAALGELLAALEADRRLEDTWVIFTSPHGELLDEEPLIFYHHHLAEIALSVPLVVRPPRSFAGERGTVVEGVFDLIDVFPTLTTWLGVPGAEALDGRDRSRDIAAGGIGVRAPSVAVGTSGFFAAACQPPFKLVKASLPDEERWPWMTSGHPADGVYLFTDGDETRDVGAANPEVRTELLAYLDQAIGDPLPSALRNRAARPSGRDE